MKTKAEKLESQRAYYRKKQAKMREAMAKLGPYARQIEKLLSDNNLKMAVDFDGQDGVVYNVLVVDEKGFEYPIQNVEGVL